VSRGQEHNNRSQGQRIRHTKENLEALIQAQEQTTEIVAQHDRDIRVMKARLEALEREQSRR
jgi:hypothetical protein